MRTWWRDTVLYQVCPRSFADSDGVGDLKGITERLDHVAALGVDGIWLSPFHPSPWADGGYDVSDFREVDPLLGTLADFDAMVEAAHSRDLRIWNTGASPVPLPPGEVLLAGGEVSEHLPGNSTVWIRT